MTRRDTITFGQLDTVTTILGYLGAGAVYSPIGDRAFVGVKTVESSGDVTVHSVDLTTGATSPLMSTVVLPGTFGINLYLAVSEDGEELLLQRNVTNGEVRPRI